MPEKRWKREERRVARLLGGKRNIQDGTSEPDVETRYVVAENKDRKTLPLWIVAALAKARAKAGSSRLGVVTVTTRESPLILVVIDMRDFRDWFGGEGK